ncbi:hypothetical protein [Streptomyces sp. NBC_00094]|uniref:hypothetical protein n=1 Tax=Streptomyces sp. NBC_00094 TaxID=2903620 RepID=UPI002250516B|nr:hypothetical protein [Streptomyces sp. NBC_00094]MCX5389417.1 hypothetical protein [Streptomyces sp. NBC_00094]
MDGVSTNLALIFGTLLSSQGTDASFVLTLSGFPPGFPSVFRVSSLADSISRFRHPLERVAGGEFAFAFSVPGGVKHYQAFPVPLTTPLAS